MNTVKLYKTLAHNYVVSDEILTNGNAVDIAKNTDQVALYWFPEFNEVVISNWTIVDKSNKGTDYTNDHTPSVYSNFALISALAKEIAFGLTESSCPAANTLGYTVLRAIEYFLELALLIPLPDWVPIYATQEGVFQNPAVGYYDEMFAPICYDEPQGILGRACAWSHGVNAITVLDNEFGLELSRLGEFIEKVKAIIKMTPTAFPLQGILMRFSDKSDIYMSTAYGRQTVHFEFYVWNRKDIYNRPSGSLAGYQTILQMLTNEFNARSHWGKSGLVYHDSESLDLKLDKTARRNFVAVMNKYDPNEIFINNFGRRLKQTGTKVDMDPLTKHCAILDNCICSENDDCASTQICTTLPGYTYNVCQTKNEVAEVVFDKSLLPAPLGIVQYLVSVVPTSVNTVISNCTLKGVVGTIGSLIRGITQVDNVLETVGTLRIVVEVTLNTVELYKTLAHNYVVSDEILTNGNAVHMAKNTDQISLYWFPEFKEVVVANWTIVDKTTPGTDYTNDHVPSLYSNFAQVSSVAKEIAFTLTESRCATASTLGYTLLHLFEYYMELALFIRVPDWVPIYATQEGKFKNPSVGYYDEMFAPICHGKPQGALGTACVWSHGLNSITILDNEFSLDLARLGDFIKAVKEIVKKTPTAFPLIGILLRFSDRSDIYMSTSYGRQSVHFEFYLWNRDDVYGSASGSLAGYQTILQKLTKEFNGRSHWGKSGMVYHSREMIDLKLDETARQNFIGIVVEVTLDTVELYKTLAYNYVVSDEILTNGSVVDMAQNTDQISLYWFPEFKEVVVANWTIVDKATPGTDYTNDHVPSMYRNFARVASLAREISFTLTESKCATASTLGYTLLHTFEYFMELALFIRVPDWVPIYATQQGRFKNPSVGYYDEMFAPICHDEPQGILGSACIWSHGSNSITILDNEFSLDLARLGDFIKAVKGIVKETPTAFPLIGILLRFSDKTDIYMSPSYGRQSVHFEFYLWNREDVYDRASGSLAGYQTILQTLAKEFNGRSHWGKSGMVYHSREMIDLKLDETARQNFIGVMNKHDPDGVFLNNFGRRIKRTGDKIDIDPKTKHCALLDNCFCSSDSDCSSTQICTKLPGYTYNVCKTKNEVAPVAFDRSLFRPPFGILSYLVSDVPTLVRSVIANCTLTNPVETFGSLLPGRMESVLQTVRTLSFKLGGLKLLGDVVEAVGIVIEVTLNTVELYKTLAYNYVVSDDILTNGNAVHMAKNTDQISLYWFPEFKEVVVANWTIVDKTTPGTDYTNDHVPSTYNNFALVTSVAKEIAFTLTESKCSTASTLGYTLLHLFEYLMELVLLVPVPDFVPIYATQQGRFKNPSVGYYDEMFAPICHDDPQGILGTACIWSHGSNSMTILDNEFSLELCRLGDFVKAVKAIVAKTPTAFPLQGILMRFSDRSDILMSTSYGRVSVHFEFYLWNRDDKYGRASGSLAGYQTILQTLAKEFNGRSHWGKSGMVYHSRGMLDLKLDEIARQKFVAVMNKYDPDEVFINNFGRRVKRTGYKLDIDPKTKHCAVLDNCFCSKNSDCAYTQICTKVPGYVYNVCKTKNDVDPVTFDRSIFGPPFGFLSYLVSDVPTLITSVISKCSLTDTLETVVSLVPSIVTVDKALQSVGTLGKQLGQLSSLGDVVGAVNNVVGWPSAQINSLINYQLAIVIALIPIRRQATHFFHILTQVIVQTNKQNR
ncbi:hypothetical protein HA402_004989 [Bradysia odoriphaga]|nr:hypothetical protein HA402_004989 [Bradysia odoriphaga]